MSDNRNFDLLGGNITPFSAEAEQSILGSVLIAPESMDKLSGSIKTEHFYIHQHQEIYNVLSDMYALNRVIDPVTVLNELKERGVYDDAGGKAYITQLVQLVPTAANLDAYISIVKEKYYTRSLMQAAQTILADIEDNAGTSTQLIERAEENIYNIRKGRETSGLVHIRDVLRNETIHRIDCLNNEETRGDYIGIPCGINALDDMLTGLNKSDLIILGARPGMGKTSFALNIARHVALKEKKTVCFFSLEMTRDQLAQRLLSAEACISSEKLRTGKIEGSEWTNLVQATEILSKAEIYVDQTTRITVNEMKAKLRRMDKVDLVIIDYLGLMASTKKTDNQAQIIGDITQNLKNMAKELNVPIICAAQLNRGGEGPDKKNHRPGLASLRDSGSIEQDADIVLFLYREHYYDTEKNDPEQYVDEHKATCIVAKNRHGRTGDVPLYWDGEHTRFTSVATNVE